MLFDRALARAPARRPRPAVELLVPQGSTSAARIADRVGGRRPRPGHAPRCVSVPFAELLGRLAAGEPRRRHHLDVRRTGRRPVVARCASRAPPSEAWCGAGRSRPSTSCSRPGRGAARRAPRASPPPRARAPARGDELAAMAFVGVDTRRRGARADVGGWSAGARPARGAGAAAARARPARGRRGRRDRRRGLGALWAAARW
ncbi:MAG: hypothetical protein HS111_16860 [Kofleriaceae bacterium]|nr:hypothetical protein [Kofleriaceae bacterium]